MEGVPPELTGHPDFDSTVPAAEAEAAVTNGNSKQDVTARTPVRQHSARRPGPPNTAASAGHPLDPPAQQQPAHGPNQQPAVVDAQLADVLSHLKQLEKAVKSHIQSADASPQHASTRASGGIGRGGSSILAATAAGHRAGSHDSCSSDDSACEHSPAGSARASERAKLRDSLSKIKSEIADKAVKEVEAQLLQQRVACLEAALAGLTHSGNLLAAAGPGCASCATSFAGSMLSLGGRPSVCFRCSQSQAQQQQASTPPHQQQQAPRESTPALLGPGVSQLYDRLGDMEAAMRELAQAQATSSNVLSELGGRLSSTAGPSWPSQLGARNTSQGRGSLLHRPPSCPLNEVPLSSWAFSSPPSQRPSNNLRFDPLPQRPSSACAATPGSPGGFSSVLANPVFSFDSPSRSSASPATPTVTSSGAAGEQQAMPAQQEQGHRTTHVSAQQAQVQHLLQQGQDWQVEVVLASHDAEIEGVKEAVSRLEAAQEASMGLAEDTAMHVASLDDRVRALEHRPLHTFGAASGSDAGAVVASGGSSPQHGPHLEATLSRGVGAAAASSSQHHGGDSSVAANSPPACHSQLTAEYEGHLAEGLHDRVTMLEAAAVKHQQDMDTMRTGTTQLHADLHQTINTLHLLPHDGDDHAAHHHAAAHAAAASHDAIIQQLLSSSLLDDLINSRVQQAVAAAAQGHSTLGAPAGAAQLPVITVLDAGLHRSAASTACTSRAHSLQELPGAFHQLCQDAAAQEVIAASVQHLHARLLAVEGTVQSLVAQQSSQHPAAARAASLLAGAACADLSSHDTLGFAAESGTEAAAAVSTLGEPSSAAVAQHDGPTKGSAFSRDAEPLTDGLSSFHSATSVISTHSTAPAEDGTLGSTATAQQEQPALHQPSSTPPADRAGEDATVAVADSGTFEASLAGGSCPANVAIEQLVQQLAVPVTALRDSSDTSGSQAAPVPVKSAQWSCRTSTTQVEKQLSALQHEVDACELQAMQSALEVLDLKLTQLHQQQLEQALLAESQKVSTGAAISLLAPLEPRVDNLSGQLRSLAEQVAALHTLVAQQPARYEVLQGEIEQLSRQLAEVNEAAAEEPDVQLLKEQLAALQQQHSQLRADLTADIKAATDAASAAAAMASTAAETAAGVESNTQQQLAAQQERQEQWQQQAADAILQRLAAVEGSVQQLGEMQEGLSHLQEKLATHMDSAREQAAVAAAAASEQHSILQTLSASAAELASKLQATELSVDDRVSKVEASVSATAEQAHVAAAAMEAHLQQQVQELRAEAAAAQDAQRDELKQQQQGLLSTLAASTDSRMSALEASVEGKVEQVDASLAASTQQVMDSLSAAAHAVDAKLEQHDAVLQATFTAAQEAHDADLKQQLKEQVDTMAQILAELGSYKAGQAAVNQDMQEQLAGLKEGQESTHTVYGARLEQLTDQLQLTAQQLQDELSSTITPLQSRLQDAAATLAEHDTALQGTHSVAAAVELLSGLPAAAADLSARLDELAQTQRAAEGELSANKEFCMALDQHVGAAQAQLRVLEATIAEQQEREGRNLQQMKQEMLEPVVQELARLQEHMLRLQQLQQEQAAAVERLGGAVEAVKSDVLGELAKERQQLAQAVEELQEVVREECVKTDQLGTIFSARDNMYGAWLKMQAVFDANKSPRRGNTAAGCRVTSDRSPSSSLFRPRFSLAYDGPSASVPAGASNASGALQTNPEAVFDPFSEVLNRLESSPVQAQQHSMTAVAEQLTSSDQDVQGLPGVFSVPVEAGAVPRAPQAASSEQLGDVAEAHAQLREEVGSLAIQLHAAMADLAEQVAALREHQAERQAHQQQPSRAVTPPAAEHTAAASAAQGEGSSMQRAASASAGVLHAPLSLVLQLQQELGAMKADCISKEQFAAVVRMVKELRSQSCAPSEASSPVARSASSRAAAAGFAAGAAAAMLSTEPSNGPAPDKGVPHNATPACADVAGSEQRDGVSEVLQQQAQQIAALESSLQSMMDKAAAADADAATNTQQLQTVQQLQQEIANLQQQQPVLQQQQEDLQQQQSELSSALLQQAAALSSQTRDLTSGLAQLQVTQQQQEEALTTGLASVSATQQQVQAISSQQGNLQAELSKVTAYVDDLASKLHSAANAAALAVSRPHGSGTLGEASGGSGFAEMVAGLANLKSCLDQQAKVVSDLSTRLEDQDGVLQGLLEVTQQGAAAAAPGSSSSSSGPESAFVSRGEMQALTDEVAAVQQKLNLLQQRPQQEASEPPALLNAPPAAAAAAGVNRDPENAVDVADGGDSTSTETESAASGHPLGFMHGMLVELKQRIKKLEADSIEAKATASTVAARTASAAAAPPAEAEAPAEAAAAYAASTAAAAAATGCRAAASTPGTPRKGPASAFAARKGAAWAGHEPTGAAGLQELQEWLVCLQGEVARLDTQNASLSATVEALRGDVGAAAAIAAANAVSHAASAATAPVVCKGGLLTSSSSLQAGQQVAEVEGVLLGLKLEVSGLWAAVDELKVGLQLRDQADLTAQAAIWASGGMGSSVHEQHRVGHPSSCTAELQQCDAASAVQVKHDVAASEAAAAGQGEAVAAVQAEDGDTARAVAVLEERVAELQASMAGVASAAAAGTLAVQLSGAHVTNLHAELEFLKLQLLSMQEQITELAASHNPAQPSDLVSGDAAPYAEGYPSADGAPAASSSISAGLQKCLSFGDLAGSSNGGTVVPAAPAAATSQPADPCFEPDFAVEAAELLAPAVAPLAAANTQGSISQDAGLISHDARVPSRQASEARSEHLSRSSSASSSRSGSSRSGKTSVRRLLEDMSVLPTSKQVAIVSKLAGLVSSHATRLLATYHDDPALSAQLQAVQQQLASAVRAAAASPPGMPGATGAASSSSSPARPPVPRVISTRRASATAAAGAGSGGSGEALLVILDQMASLRAIGSATHPAIAETLQKHEAQLAELREAQQGITAAISALTGGLVDTTELQPAQAPGAISTTPQQHPVAAAAEESQSERAPAAADLAGSSSLDPAPVVAPAAAGAETGEVAQQVPGGVAVYEGELSHRLLDVESRLAAGLKVLSAVRSKMSPLQEVADATQSMMRELQVAHGLALHRLEALESLASSGAAATAAGTDSAGAVDEQQQQAGGVLAVAGSLKKLQEDIQAAGRRLSGLEASVAAQVPECLMLSRRMAARQADAETRSSTLTAKVSTLVTSLPPLVERVAELEGRLTRSLTVAKQGLDILADQLVALGALNGRSSPNKNPLAALGPNSAAITALEGKVEAVRTAMTASVKLMIQELAAEVEQAGEAGSIRIAMGTGVGSGVAGVQVAAEEAAKAAAAARDEAMLQLEQKLSSLQAELRAVTRSSLRE